MIENMSLINKHFELYLTDVNIYLTIDFDELLSIHITMA